MINQKIIKKNWLEISLDVYERQIDRYVYLYLLKSNNKKWECVVKNYFFDYERILIKDCSLNKAYYRAVNYINWYSKKYKKEKMV